MMRLPLLLILTAPSLCAQAAFDSASIKPTPPMTKVELAAHAEVTPGSVSMIGATLRSTVAWAYSVREDQISGPSWIASDRFDILAKSAAAAPVSDLRLMMQALLADRFGLALHRQSKDGQVLVITVGPDGPKLTPSEAPGPPKLKLSDGAVTYLHFTLPELADRLSAAILGLGRPVIDRTGIEGTYDFTVHTGATPVEMKMAAERATQGGELPDPSPYVAAFRDAGLKLESRKEPVETLVIDRAERSPKAN